MVIIIKQFIVKCNLSKSIKTTCIWFYLCWELKMFKKCMVKHSVTLNKVLIKWGYKQKAVRMMYVEIIHRVIICFSTMASPSYTGFLLGLGRKWYHRLSWIMADPKGDSSLWLTLSDVRPHQLGSEANLIKTKGLCLFWLMMLRATLSNGAKGGRGWQHTAIIFIESALL